MYRYEGVQSLPHLSHLRLMMFAKSARSGSLTFGWNFGIIVLQVLEIMVLYSCQF